MLKHMFMFDWAVEEDEDRTREKLAIVREALESQVASIPGVVAVDRVGLNTVPGSHAKAVFVEMTFRDPEALPAYHRSAEHHAVRGIVDPLITGLVIVDFVEESR